MPHRLIILCLALAAAHPAAAQLPGITDTTSRALATHVLTVIDSARLRASNVRSVAEAIAAVTRGATIVTLDGSPGIAPVIVLRGSAVHDVTDPLVVIDGNVARGPLDDVDVNDIERIEVLNGPAATAAYGLGAANGVVRISTRRGHDLGPPGVRFAFRSEAAAHLRPRILPINEHHAFQLDGAGNFVLDGSGNRVPETDGINDNVYPRRYDAPDALLQRSFVLTNHLSAQHNEQAGAGGIFASLRHERDPGTLPMLSGFDEKAIRLNVDRSFGRRLSAGGGAYLMSSMRDVPTAPGQLFAALRLVEPHGKLDSTLTPCPIADACYTSAVPAGRLGTVANPLYVIQSNVFDEDRRRIRADVNASFRVLEWLGVRGAYASDRMTDRFLARQIQGGSFQTEIDDEERTDFGSAVATATYAIGTQVRSSTSLGFSHERRFRKSERVQGTASGPSASSAYQFTGTTPSYFAAAAFDFGSQIVLDGAVRRDEPSLYGPHNKALYHRFGVSYLPIDGIRLHAAHGTAGALLPDTTLLTFSVGPVVPLRLPFVHETEAGTQLTFGRLTLSYDFAHQRITGYARETVVPTSTGFITDIRNIGDVVTRSHALSLGAALLNGRSIGWRMDLVAHRARSILDRLHTPPFYLTPHATYRLEEGQELNLIGGTRWVRTEAQLIETISTGQLTGTVADYVLNEEGYYVRVTQHRTPNEIPLAYAQCTESSGGACTAFETLFSLGRTTPDVALGLTNSLRLAAVTLNATLSGAIGGVVYNHGRRNDILRERDAILDQSARTGAERKPGSYYRAFLTHPIHASTFPSEFLVEDATHVKLRDVSLEWRMLGGLSLGVVARNVLSVGGYDGHDPDVAVQSATLFDRNVDLFQYPAPRTIGVVARVAF